jgi:hypothetical protein
VQKRTVRGGGGGAFSGKGELCVCRGAELKWFFQKIFVRWLIVVRNYSSTRLRWEPLNIERK